ncbi:flagellar biosynthesis protein FlhB [Anaerobacillus sp. MEB173]|uniref:flagellar biosynthesis protein FlhB n=1 Tax=Anaerobacillus sp. MEB173 TaxID=3383345 RepID=UPI003F8E2036
MAYLSLDLQYFSQEKTEKATPKKKEETRKKGQVAKSTDVNTALSLLLVFFILWFIGGYVGNHLLELFQHTFQEYLLLDVTERTIEMVFLELVMETAIVISPILLIALIAGILSSYIQVGFLFAPEAIKMKLSKIDPIKGFKRIFSVRAIVELLKSLLKITLVGIVAFTILWLNIDSILILSQKSVGTALIEIGQLTVMIGIACALMLLILSVPDYLYQKYDHEKQIRMSKQDIKDEHKKSEGDPLIKSKRKQKQMQMAMQRMMQEVPKADVVITNPTHFAVALKYEGDKMEAPIIVAKGVDYLALKIKGIAKSNNVITVENRPLARALYSQADIGDQVPEDLFKAVAEVLAYVYRLKNKV